jgi:4-hydroxy-4-methyl-2-oxoglutarate aldolase
MTKEDISMIHELSRFSTATIHEALGKSGNLPSGIKPIARGMKVCGPAYTVQTIARDNKIIHSAYANAKSGDVLVVHCSDYYEAGYWGDLMSLGAKTKGIAGLVIDACVRDADDIEAMNFPVFSRGLCIRGTTSLEGGALNKAIVIGGVTINPGDIVAGDRDGVVIVPKELLAATIEKAKAREIREESIREQLRQGKTSMQIYGWDQASAK